MHRLVVALALAEEPSRTTSSRPSATDGRSWLAVTTPLFAAGRAGLSRVVADYGPTNAAVVQARAGIPRQPQR